MTMELIQINIFAQIFAYEKGDFPVFHIIFFNF